MHIAKRDIGLLVVGFFMPPLAVFIKRGLGFPFILNIGLTFCGAVPGIAHAWYTVIRFRIRPINPEMSKSPKSEKKHPEERID
ncbi:hypothetical protein BDF19DRAFT_462137 [Syncephalis fuscata]|nr:hypothetical protein BDF19DRAFT_462137 [Syncephalis fuscata]